MHKSNNLLFQSDIFYITVNIHNNNHKYICNKIPDFTNAICYYYINTYIPFYRS